MASLNNNWLSFSISPDLQNHTQNPVFNSSPGDQSVFDISDNNNISIIPSLNLHPTPNFAIFEALNTTNTTHHPQEWNMKDLSMNNQQRPKLENFLRHSFSDHRLHEEHGKICNPNNNNNINISSPKTYCGNNNNSTNIGLSMIKTWLRNNPPHAAEEDEAPAAAGAQTLSLSMSAAPQSSSTASLPLISVGAVESCAPEHSKLQQCGGGQTGGALESTPRKSIDTFGQRTSIYRGVTRHRWTGRYEAHLWDNSCRREGQTRKGRQVYLGGYDKEEKAARAYDLAALKYWGTTTTTNFPISNYEKEVEEMKHMTRQEHVASLRRKSSGFSRGASIYRGVTRHHQHGRWQARIGRVAGNKDLYLGTFSTQEEAAEAYDIAAIKFRGLNAVTNFEINRYDVKSILESTTLPIGGAAKRLKDAEKAEMALEMHRANEANLNLHLTDHHGHINVGCNIINNDNNNNMTHNWPTIAFQQSQPLTSAYTQRSLWCKQEQDYDENNNNNPQLQLGNTHYNFIQPPVLPSIMSLDDSNNSLTDGNGFAMPIMMGPAAIVQHPQENGFLGHNDHHCHAEKYEGVFGSTDARNLYYHQFQQSSSSAGLAKASIYDQGASCNNNWNIIPTAVPTVNGTSTFTVWNDP